jgi:apolipoprotein N-acyltransferase
MAGPSPGREDIHGERGAMQRAVDWVAQSAGAKRALIAALAGAISVLAFAPLHLWPVLFASFGLLVWLLDGCYATGTGLRPRLKCASLTGFWFGFGYFLTGFYWIAEAFLVEPWRHGWLIPLVMTAMPGGMALFYAAAAALAMLLWRPGPARVFALAIALALAEYARGHVLTGLPWNLIGYGLTAGLPAMQLAALVGIYALSLVAVLLFASPFAIWAPAGSGLARRNASMLLTLVLLVAYLAGFVWGDRRLAAADFATTDVRLRIVQANVDQANKWRPENSLEIFEDYLKLTRTGGAAPGFAGITLVIWPETAVPFLLGDTAEALTSIAETLPEGTSLLVGSPRVAEERDAAGTLLSRRVYNSLFVIDDRGVIRETYDKIHLVPFGEYLPFQDFMESLGFLQMTGVRGGFSEGQGPRLIDVPGAPQASPLICYEIIFPGDVTDRKQRPGWLLNLTNDGWFGVSTGPFQHFQQARIRAIEEGLPLVRVANTGISAVVDPLGRVIGSLPLGIEGVLDLPLPRAIAPPLHARLGDGPMGIGFGLAVLWLLRSRRPSQQK